MRVPGTVSLPARSRTNGTGSGAIAPGVTADTSFPAQEYRAMSAIVVRPDAEGSGVGATHGADVATALGFGVVRVGGCGQQPTNLLDGVESFASHPVCQSVEQRSGMVGPVPEQRRGGHHHVRPG